MNDCLDIHSMNKGREGGRIYLANNIHHQFWPTVGVSTYKQMWPCNMHFFIDFGFKSRLQSVYLSQCQLEAMNRQTSPTVNAQNILCIKTTILITLSFNALKTRLCNSKPRSRCFELCIKLYPV